MNIAVSRSLIDDDQGVCPEGHACHLVEREQLDFDRFVRECGEPHAETEGEPYQGDPLISWALTPAELRAAAEAGADPTLVGTAEAFLQARRG